MSCDIPEMPERVFDTAHPVSVELIRHRSSHLRPRTDSLVEYRVYLIAVEKDTHRRPAKRLRTACFHLRQFVREHDGRIANSNLGVADLPISFRHAQQFRCAKCLLIELDR